MYRRLDALRAHRASAVAGAVIAVVLALLAASGAAQVLSPAYRTQLGGARAAVQRGLPAHAPGAPNVIPARLPTLVQPPCCGQGAVAEQIPGTDGSALIDGVFGPLTPVWRSPAGFPTADLRLRVRDASPAARVLLAYSTAAPPETWARVVEVWLSLDPGGADPIRLGQWTLAQTTAPQEFPVPPTRVASARLRVVANYGSPEYASLAEFALLPPSSGGRRVMRHGREGRARRPPIASWSAWPLGSERRRRTVSWNSAPAAPAGHDSANLVTARRAIRNIPPADKDMTVACGLELHPKPATETSPGPRGTSAWTTSEAPAICTPTAPQGSTCTPTTPAPGWSSSRRR